jgi:ATP-dependent RNA helicase DDX56/DBP9
VLNSELPANSRIHIVQEFSKGIYDIIIAADDLEVLGSEKPSQKSKVSFADDGVKTGEPGTAENSTEEHKRERDDVGSNSEDEEKETVVEQVQHQNKRLKKTLMATTEKQKDYGISRGIDFQNVACVVNFDLPTTSKSYTHRIGRTGRAGKTGMALSFVIPSELFGKHKPTSNPISKHDEAVLAKIVNKQAKQGHEVKPYHFDMHQVNAFRYRMTDAIRAVTRLAVREARAREIRQELVKSEKLQRHFEENPAELRHLRHDSEVRAARIQPHLKHVPDYLMPTKGKKGISSEDIGYVGLRKTNENRIRKARERNRGRGKKPPTGSRSHYDPLKSFNARGRRK